MVPDVRKNHPETETFVVEGIIEEEETGRPLAGLIVRAFDRDLLLDDRLGFTTSDIDGRFEIRFGPEAFRDVFESRPDLYLRIFDSSGLRLLHDTSDAIRRNAEQLERYSIRISARSLDPRS